MVVVSVSPEVQASSIPNDSPVAALTMPDTRSTPTSAQVAGAPAFVTCHLTRSCPASMMVEKNSSIATPSIRMTGPRSAKTSPPASARARRMMPPAFGANETKFTDAC